MPHTFCNLLLIIDFPARCNRVLSAQFRFATCRDVLMMAVGATCAVLHGSAQPLMLLVFGLLTDTFIEYDIELKELSDERKECVNNTIQWKQNVTNLTSEMLIPLKNMSCG